LSHPGGWLVQSNYLFQSGGGITKFSTMAEPVTVARPRKCPICGKAAAERFRPFCSQRCSDVDLNRWLTGNYAIPAAEDDDEAEQKAEEEE
jgi:uncharacterized protein